MESKAQQLQFEDEELIDDPVSLAAAETNFQPCWFSLV